MNGDIKRTRQRTIQRGLHQARTVCFAAVAGSTTRGTAGRRAGAGTRRIPRYYFLGFRVALVPAE